jgi:integrase
VEDGGSDATIAEKPVITHEQYLELKAFLTKKNNPALLPIQIAYFTGVRIGEACGLTWQDIDLKEQCLTIRRSMRYNPNRKKTELGPTKRKKIRTVDFCDTLAGILREAKKNQMLNSFNYGSYIGRTTIGSSRKRTAPIMRFIPCREPKHTRGL